MDMKCILTQLVILIILAVLSGKIMASDQFFSNSISATVVEKEMVCTNSEKFFSTSIYENSILEENKFLSAVTYR